MNVELFDSQKYMFGNSDEMSDNVHPNVLGQLELAHSVLDVLNPPASPVKSAVAPPQYTVPNMAAAPGRCFTLDALHALYCAGTHRLK